MYEHDRSASKGQMSTILPVIIFKHVGTDSNEQQRENQAKLGCAPAHKLFELVKLEKNDKNSLSRSYSDYTLRIAASKLPKGVEIGFAFPQSSIASISWGVVPDDLKWVVLE